MASTHVTHYNTKATKSSRTHQDTIDVECDSIRIFLKDEQVLGLIAQMFKALATPFTAGNIDTAITAVGEELQDD
jgi:hypothetical protein